ncbi:MAG: hypothetical protein P1V97_21740, partial [Planctomycetota bacterium]|nr:hypothetical protein [Planctomycetota bacterium]
NDKAFLTMPVFHFDLDPPYFLRHNSKEGANFDSPKARANDSQIEADPVKSKDVLNHFSPDLTVFDFLMISKRFVRA